MSMLREEPNWAKDIAPYQKPDIRKSLWQIANTIVPFLVLWTAAYLSLWVSVYLTLVLTVPAAGFLVRTFIIFHDCGHHSFFKSRWANELVGILTGLLAFFPYQQWKFSHSVHHAGNGNLERRGLGDIMTLTVDEYLALPTVRKILYRLYRHPLVLFGLGPVVLILVMYRFNRRGAGRRERFNTHFTSAVLIALVAVLCWALGWEQFLLVEGPILYLSGMAGIWLFYVQHQFEDGYFEKPENWSYVTAALQGSSFYRLPRVLQWMTGNIGFHHIHHLGPRIPNYNLQRLYDSNAYLQQVPTISLASSLQSLKFRVWDEKSKRLIGFRQIVQSKATQEGRQMSS